MQGMCATGSDGRPNADCESPCLVGEKWDELRRMLGTKHAAMHRNSTVNIKYAEWLSHSLMSSAFRIILQVRITPCRIWFICVCRAEFQSHLIKFADFVHFFPTRFVRMNRRFLGTRSTRSPPTLYTRLKRLVQMPAQRSTSKFGTQKRVSPSTMSSAWDQLWSRLLDTLDARGSI